MGEEREGVKETREQNERTLLNEGEEKEVNDNEARIAAKLQLMMNHW